MTGATAATDCVFPPPFFLIKKIKKISQSFPKGDAPICTGPRAKHELVYRRRGLVVGRIGRLSYGEQSGALSH